MSTQLNNRIAGQHPETDPNFTLCADLGAKPVVDFNVVAVINSLDEGENGEFLADLVNANQASTTKLLEALRLAVTDQDVDALRVAAHHLKSTSGNLGATRMVALCEGLETLGRDSALSGAEAELEAALESEYRQVISALDSVQRVDSMGVSCP